MKRSERIDQAKALYVKLAEVESQLSTASSSTEAHASRAMAAIRALMAALEHQISLLRLIQSEDRLRQQLWIALPSLAGGAVLTLLVQYLKA